MASDESARVTARRASAAGADGDRGSLTQMVAQELRESILAGRLEPGARVGQDALAQRYGVSRIPVREALRLLETEGLVVQRPHSGARVAELDFEECLEIYKVRERLEPLAFSESCGLLGEEQLETVVATRERLRALEEDPAAWLACDREFHLACYAGVSTPRLLGMIQGFWNTTQQYRRILLQTFDAEDFALADAEHALMIDALRTGNVDAGEAIVRIAMERSRLRLARHRELFDR